MTRKVRDSESWLSAYLENDLPREAAAEVEAHIGECAACRARKEKMEELLFGLAELQEEVPFFLKNRLYNIPETVEKKGEARVLHFPQWLAAAIGTIVLFLNLFYFTNVFPAANRQMHALVSSVEKFVVRTGGWFEKVKETQELLFFTFFNKKTIDVKDAAAGQDGLPGKGYAEGGKNG